MQRGERRCLRMPGVGSYWARYPSPWNRRQGNVRTAEALAQPWTDAAGRTGILHGALSYLMSDAEGQVIETHSVSAGLDYPGVGPEHANLAATKRARYEDVTDQEALEALTLLCRTEGILCALESAHAVAGALRAAKQRGPDEIVVVTLSGRGDKDVHTVADALGVQL